MFGLIEEIGELACNVTRIVTAPVELAVKVINVPLGDVAEVSQDIIDGIR